MAHRSRLSKLQRWQLASRYTAGEHRDKLAEEFKVNPGYPAQLAFLLGFPKKVSLSHCPHCKLPLAVTRTKKGEVKCAL